MRGAATGGCTRVFDGIDVASWPGISADPVGSEVETLGELQPKVPAIRNTTIKYAKNGKLLLPFTNISRLLIIGRRSWFIVNKSYLTYVRPNLFAISIGERWFGVNI